MSDGMYSIDDNGKIYPVSDCLEWARQFGKCRDKWHLNTAVTHDICVSTAFLGLDHNWTGQGSPILWESMVFDSNGSELDQEQWRCAGNFEQAECMHMRMVEHVERVLKERNENHTGT